MMNKLLGLLFLIILFSCAEEKKSSVGSKFSATKTEKEAEQMLRAYHAAINQYGLIAEFKFLENSNNFYWVPPGFNSALSYDSVHSIILEYSKSIVKVNFEWKELELNAVDNDFVTFNGIVQGELIDTSGLVTEVRQIESGLLHRTENGWKILSGHSTKLKIENDQKELHLTPVDIITVYIPSIGPYKIIGLDNSIETQNDMGTFELLLNRKMILSEQNKIKILSDPNTNYKKVFDVLGIIMRRGWIPTMALNQ